MIYKYDPSLIDGLSFFYRGFKEKPIRPTTIRI